MRWLHFLAGVLLLLGLLVYPFSPSADAAAGRLVASDFSYRGISLGSTESEVVRVLGETLFDKDIRRQGIAVKALVYPNGVEVALARRSGKVVDITVDLSKQKEFELRDGVRYGATSAWLQQVYGKEKREWLEGEVYYIYKMQARPYDRLLLSLDTEDYHLKAMRITNLPLTEEEYDARAGQGDDELEAMSDAVMGDKQIDTSALPQTDEVKLGGYLP